MQMVVSSEWLQTVSWEMKYLLDSSTEFHALQFFIFSVVRSSSWGSLGWRWQVDDEVDVVMLRDQLRERDPESRGKGPMNDETGINRVRVRSSENLLRFEHLQHFALDLRCNSRFQVRTCFQIHVAKKDDLWRFTRSFHSPPLMSNETHQWFMRIQLMYPPQSNLHTK